MKVYKLYLAKPLLIFYLAILTLWVFAGVAGSIYAAAGGFGSDGPPAILFIAVLMVAIFNAYMWLRIPFEIKVQDDGTMEFRSVLRRVAIPASQIKSVRAKRYAVGFIDVVH